MNDLTLPATYCNKFGITNNKAEQGNRVHNTLETGSESVVVLCRLLQYVR